MKSKRADAAVTETVGTILLLGMTVSLFSMLSIIVLSYPFTPAPPSVDLVGTINGDNIIVEHCGGEALSLDTKIVLMLGDTKENIIVGNESYFDDSNGDGLWNIGERLVYLPAVGISNLQIKVTVVDVHSNSVIMMGTIQKGTASTS